MNKGLNRAIGVQLYTVRTSNNLTALQLADRVGTSFDAIMGFESGDQRVPPAMLVTIAAELNVPISSFFIDLVNMPTLQIRLH